LIRLGRFVFAGMIAATGLQHGLALVASAQLAPGSPWVVGDTGWACVFGGILVGTSTGMVAARRVVVPAVLLGLVLFLYDAIVYAPGIVVHVRDPRNWTAGTKILAMSGAALVIAARPGAQQRRLMWSGVSERLLTAGLLLFAASVFVWSVQHFMYAQFTAGLVPAWLPWRVFWVVLVGVAFLAASLGFAFRVHTRLAGVLLSVVFLFITLLVQLPRVFGDPRSGQEWTSLLVAAGMCGAALSVAEALPQRPPSFVRTYSDS
jgi:hypothetical protein